MLFAPAAKSDDMIHLSDFRELVIRPALAVMARCDSRMNSRAAELLLSGTAYAESRVGQSGLQQHPGGPALGVFQMEARGGSSTFEWLWRDFLSTSRRHGWREHIADGCGLVVEDITADRLVDHLVFAGCLARLRYWVVPSALPSAEDRPALAAYWRKFYNGNPRDEDEKIRRFLRGLELFDER